MDIHTLQKLANAGAPLLKTPGVVQTCLDREGGWGVLLTLAERAENREAMCTRSLMTYAMEQEQTAFLTLLASTNRHAVYAVPNMIKFAIEHDAEDLLVSLASSAHIAHELLATPGVGEYAKKHRRLAHALIRYAPTNLEKHEEEILAALA